MGSNPTCGIRKDVRNMRNEIFMKALKEMKSLAQEVESGLKLKKDQKTVLGVVRKLKRKIDEMELKINNEESEIARLKQIEKSMNDSYNEGLMVGARDWSGIS